MIKQNTYKWSLIYLAGAILPMVLACILKSIMKAMQMSNNQILQLIILAIGGLSSAVSGVIVSLKSKRVHSLKAIVSDFFQVKDSIWNYLLVLLLIFILFSKQILGLEINEGVFWFTFPFLFLQSVLFGGIEEIGWRYTFQPEVEKKIPYELASVITFLAWAGWHYMYFYITDMLSSMHHISFLISLLTSCFVLGAIYKNTHNLWLCVLYHCLLNVFTQTMMGPNMTQTVVVSCINIMLSIIWVRFLSKRFSRERVCR